MAGQGEDVGVWRGVRWKVAGCSDSCRPEVVPRGKRKEVNRSDLFWLRVFSAFVMRWKATVLPTTLEVRA